MTERMNRRSQTKTGGRPATTSVIPGNYALSVGKPRMLPPNGWEWVPLSDIARLETGHTPSRKHPEYWDGDIPWVGIKDATENHGRIIYDTYQHTNQFGIENSSARLLPENTVCLSRTASVGYVVVMGRPMATSQDFVNWVCSDALDYRFLKYVLLSETDSFLRFASGTTHQTVYFPEVKAFHVLLPPLAEQHAIAQILGSLDDKIELNRRMNATLEATARALFQSWFVDFDPVHAKARGEQPADMDAATAALFPDSFEESALGLIPAGWRVGTLGDVLELAYGKALKADKRNDGNVPVYGSNGLVGWHDEKLASGPGIVVGRKGNPGTVTWIPVDFFPIDTTFYVVPMDSSLSLEFLLFLLELQDLPSLSADSAVPGLNRNIAYMNKLIWPDESLAKLFTSIAQSILGKIAQNEHESRTLAETRDALLPKLVSGEVRVPHP